jgi:hypothetical protein
MTIYIATYAQNCRNGGKVCNSYTMDELEAMYHNDDERDGDIVIHAGTIVELTKWAQDVIDNKGYDDGSNGIFRWYEAENVLTDLLAMEV